MQEIDQQQAVAYAAIQKADLPAVLAIETAVHAYPWQLSHFETALDAGNLTLLMTIDGQVVGYVVMMVVLDEASLLNISIAKDYQRQGYGRQLLAQAIKAAQKKQCRKVFLEVRTSNQAAIQLYASHQFTKMGLRRNYYPAENGREDAVLMGLSI